MRSPERRTFEPPNSFPVLAWADDVAIRFILVLVVLTGGSWSEVFSAAVFNEQISTSETPTTGEQTTDGDKRGRKVGGDQTVLCNKSPKTLLEAITRNKGDTGTNEPNESQRLDPDRPHLPEASTTVGKGRMILEGGYTSTKARFHRFPPKMLRKLPCRDARRVVRSANWREFSQARALNFWTNIEVDWDTRPLRRQKLRSMGRKDLCRGLH
jgi:hypothetical protein